MNDLWPADITSDAVLSPQEVLESQAELLGERTGSLLRAHIVHQETDDRIVLGFEIESVRAGVRVRLFDVLHRLEFAYPAAFVPPPTLPEYLERRMYKAGTSGFMDKIIGTSDQWVENEWVATSPKEFEEKLRHLLALPQVKATVLSLLSSAEAQEPAADDESENGQDT